MAEPAPAPASEWTPMLLAVKAGDTDAVRRLLEAGEPAQPPAPSTVLTPILVAACKGHVAVLELLLQHGADVNSIILSDSIPPERWSLLAFTVPRGNMEVIEWLLQHGADPNCLGSAGTPLIITIQEERHNLPTKAAVVRTLLRGGADPDARTGNYREMTALMMACRLGFVDAAEELLLTGAGLELGDENGWTALYWAVVREHTEAARLLIRHGASLECRNSVGMTPLMVAAQLGSSESAELLLLAGAAPNVVDEGGWTALHWAAAGGHLETARLLLSHRASLEIRNKPGWNAVDMAANQHPLEFDCGPMVDLLLASGAEPTLSEQTAPGWELIYRSERGRREACEALLREERAKVESFKRALPHIVACAATASNKRPRV